MCYDVQRRRNQLGKEPVVDSQKDTDALLTDDELTDAYAEAVYCSPSGANYKDRYRAIDLIKRHIATLQSRLKEAERERDEAHLIWQDTVARAVNDFCHREGLLLAENVRLKQALEYQCQRCLFYTKRGKYDCCRKCSAWESLGRPMGPSWGTQPLEGKEQS
jgi:hypothetical protein